MKKFDWLLVILSALSFLRMFLVAWNVNEFREARDAGYRKEINRAIVFSFYFGVIALAWLFYRKI